MLDAAHHKVPTCQVFKTLV